MSSCYEIWSLNYDLMVGFSPGDYSHPQGAAATGLADHWTVSDGGRVWTFHIRSGVKWQDGVPLTAHDVAFTYNYVIKNQLSNYTMYTQLRQERDRPRRQHRRLHLHQAQGQHAQHVGLHRAAAHLGQDLRQGGGRATSRTRRRSWAAGPFQLTQYKKDSYAIMTANKNYWGGAPKIDEVDLRLLPERRHHGRRT